VPSPFVRTSAPPSFPATLAGIACDQGISLDAVEVWFQDEARIGQKNGITRRWARRGTRPCAPQDQRYASTYIFGAVCPLAGKGAALVLPFCNTAAMSRHLAEIGEMVSPGSHAVLLLDQAGWHLSDEVAVPDNMTLLPLPPKCPELNVMEKAWTEDR
jgi:DDE superfamily endonuclease